MKTKLLNFITIIICMNLIFMPSLVFALAPEGGWENAGKHRIGASTIYAGRKVEDGKVYSGIATTRPTFTQVLGKVIKVGVGASVVVDALDVLLDGVDYVMYEENNRVKFRTKEPVLCYMMGTPCFSTEEEAIAYVREYYDKFWQGRSYEFHILRQANGDPHFQAVGTYSDGRPDVRTSPYRWKNKVATAEEVANQVIANAEKKDAQAEEFVGQIADETMTQAQKNESYEASKRLSDEASPNPKEDPNASPNPKEDPNASPNPKEDPNASPNPKEDPNEKKEPQKEPEPFELPEFCTWATPVCDTAEKLQKWVDEAKEAIKNFFKEDEKNTEVEIEDNANSNNVDTNISFSGYCPAPVTLVNFNFFGSHIYYEFTYDRFCQMLQSLRLIVIAIGGFIAVMIIGGVRTKDE